MKETQMTVSSDTGAPLDHKLRWNLLDWPTIEREVKRLQMRIAKATREKRFGKVRALQRLMTHSYYAKLLAVKRVTSNKGSRTPGVDGTVWRSHQKFEAVTMLQSKGYRAQPLRRIYIPKKNGKSRPLGIPTMKDRAMQALYLLGLEPVAETTSDPNSYGFRPLRSTQDAAQQCFIALSRKNCAKWILEADIKACFDQISHEWLLDHVVMDRKILKQWLKAGYLEKQKLYCTKEGTPQGGVSSPTLANITLNGLESAIKKAAKRGQKVNVIRYADDFIVTGISVEVLEHIKVTIESFLAERGLKLSAEKTKITNINDGFDFLGFNFRKYKQKLRTKPAKANVKKIRATIRDVTRKSRSSKTEELIKRLNPKLRGWGNYYRHVAASKAYDDVDHEVFKAVWAWAKRRHPLKSAKWRRNKYFRHQNGRNWIFHAKVTDNKGNKTLLDVVYVKKTRIRPYVKIKALATPYDPSYKEYFEQRQKWKRPSSSGYWSHNIVPKLYNA